MSQSKRAKSAERDRMIRGKPPRVSRVVDPPESLRELLTPPPGAERYSGRIRPDLTQLMLHNPGVVRTYRPIPPEQRRLIERDQELVILRTAWLCQVPFIWGEHVRIGKAVGLTAQEIERVTEGSSAQGWSAHERALLRAAEELRGEGMISDETWDTLARTLDEAQLVELPALIGQYTTLGYIQNCLRVPLWDGNDGLASR
jgi:hypothetical protein